MVESDALGDDHHEEDAVADEHFVEDPGDVAESSGWSAEHQHAGLA